MLTYSSLETRPELLGADRELTSLVAQKLVEGAKSNKEKITVVAGSAVQRYKDEHLNWQVMAPEDIGEHFRADYVIAVEVDKLTLYEPLSNNELYRGQAELSVTLRDVRKPGSEPVFHKEYATEYPRSRPDPRHRHEPAQVPAGVPHAGRYRPGLVLHRPYGGRQFPLRLRGSDKKGVRHLCRNGPEGVSHQGSLTPFVRASNACGPAVGT